MRRPLLSYFPTAQVEELDVIERETIDLNEREFEEFVIRYHAKRQSPENMLLFAAIGLVGIAGIHRFLINQVGMGILYLLTGGLCLIGTIVDMVNYRQIAQEYNRKLIMETVDLIKYY